MLDRYIVVVVVESSLEQSSVLSAYMCDFMCAFDGSPISLVALKGSECLC